jgi:N-acetylglucosamine-6-phosphate deacetylase
MRAESRGQRGKRRRQRKERRQRNGTLAFASLTIQDSCPFLSNMSNLNVAEVRGEQIASIERIIGKERGEVSNEQKANRLLLM